MTQIVFSAVPTVSWAKVSFKLYMLHSFQSFAKTSVSVAMVPVMTWVFQHASAEQPAVAVAAAGLV